MQTTHHLGKQTSYAIARRVILHQYSSYGVTLTTALLPCIMSSSNVRWSCKTCDTTLDTPQRTHPTCRSQTTYTCLGSGHSGHFDMYKRHAQHCGHCTPAQQQHILEEKAAATSNRMATVEEDEKRRVDSYTVSSFNVAHSNNTGTYLGLSVALCAR
jgi:hypothetical protein